MARFDKVLVDSCLEAINNAMIIAVESANAKARQRLADAPCGAEYVLAAEQGWQATTGGGVPNSYRDRAESSVVAVAWFTDATGRKHVRIVGERVDAPKSTYGRKDPKVWGVTDGTLARMTTAEMVYPDLMAPRPAKSRTGKKELSFCESIQADPLDLAVRMAYADWLEENQRYNDAAQQRKAVEQIQSICGEVVPNV